MTILPDSTKPASVPTGASPDVAAVADARERGGAAAAAAAESVARRLAKRERQRGYVKKAYERQKDKMQALRREVETLEAQWEAMLRLGVAGSGAAETEEDDDDAPRTRREALLRQHRSALVLKKQLYAENKRLYHATAAAMKHEGRIQQILDEIPQLSTAAQPYQFVPLPDDEYFKVLLESRDHVLRFANSTEKISSGARVFGWRDHRRVHNDKLDFGIQKAFPSHTPVGLLEATWGILSSPPSVTKLYSAAMNPRAHLLQQIDNDTLLCLVVLEPTAAPVTVKLCLLMSRERTQNGFLIVMRSVDHERLQIHDRGANDIVDEALGAPEGPQRRQVEWREVFTWVTLEESAVGSTLFQFSGSGIEAGVWVLEVLMIALRWENLVVGNSLLLPCES